MESIQVTFNGSTDFGKKTNATVSRNGDLVWKMYLEIGLPSLVTTGGTAAWTHNIGTTLIEEVYIEIGGQKIDDQYGIWLKTDQKCSLNNRCASEINFSFITINFATLSNCGEPLKTNKYQGYIERYMWPRKELGYGNNFISLSNPHPNKLNNNLLVQRLNVSGK